MITHGHYSQRALRPSYCARTAARTLEEGQHLVAEIIVAQRTDEDDTVAKFAQRTGHISRRSAGVWCPVKNSAGSHIGLDSVHQSGDAGPSGNEAMKAKSDNT